MAAAPTTERLVANPRSIGRQMGGLHAGGARDQTDRCPRSLRHRSAGGSCWRSPKNADHIEHDILRPEFKDPRVHFAINCASKGCPPLYQEPFAGSQLDMQLNEVTRHFINNPELNRLEGNVLYVSSIFKWFLEDFNNDIIGFFEQYASDRLKNQIITRRSSLNIKYLDYDWSLNGK